MNKIQVVTAAVALAIGGAAFAQAPAGTPTHMNPVNGKMPNPQFSSLDTNKDGKISRDEAKAHADMGTSWDSLDADHDTYLSESEYSKWKSPGPAAAGSKAGAGAAAPAGGK